VGSRRAIRGAALLTAVAAGLCGCTGGSPKPASGGRVSVVAGENTWGDIARQIGGSHVSVTSIITNPNTDPHIFESDPRSAAQIDNAQVVIVNGAGYDDFMTKILATDSRAARKVITVQDVVAATGDNVNPHFWYWTSRLPRVAAAIRSQLAAVDPTDAAAFTASARRFDRSLAPLLRVIARIKHSYSGTPVGYTERVPGYLVQAAGLTLGTPASFSQAVEDGTDPSPQDTQTFDGDIIGHRVKLLLYNSQVVDAQTTAVKRLATTAHLPVVGMSETLPPSYPTFQAWQLAQDNALLSALGG
jgi:zinc/manganese transport system substrate-binding protein